MFLTLTLVDRDALGTPDVGGVVDVGRAAHLDGAARHPVRRLPRAASRAGRPHVRARRCAVLALLSFLDVPIVHFSVQWWNGLHQQDSVLNRAHSRSTARCSATLLLSFVAMTLVFVWMVQQRYEIAVKRRSARSSSSSSAALAERRAEGVR